VQFSWPIGEALVDNLGEQIWEARSRLKDRIAQSLVTVHNQEIVLLHGFIKKDRKTPLDDLRLAKKRRSLYRSGHE
jgi:phage-related protein